MDSFFGICVRKIEAIAFGVSFLKEFDSFLAEKSVSEEVLLLIAPRSDLVSYQFELGGNQIRGAHEYERLSSTYSGRQLLRNRARCSAVFAEEQVSETRGNV